MIKHIVAWKLKGENKEENARLVKQKLEALVGKIPGLLKAKVVRTEPNCEYDIALISKLESAEALAGYQTNPAHTEVSSFVRSVTEQRACIDYNKNKGERKGVITMKGNPMTLAGHEVKVGDTAPDFTVLSDSMAPVSLKNFDGKFKVISVTPSIDTAT